MLYKGNEKTKKGTLSNDGICLRGQFAFYVRACALLFFNTIRILVTYFWAIIFLFC